MSQARQPPPSGIAATSSLISDLFAPLTATQFLSEIYGHKPVHVTGEANRFAHLFSWDALNRLLEQHRPEPPRLRLIKGQQIDPKSYTSAVKHARGFIDRLDWELLQQQLQAGATLKLDDIDEMHEPVTRLCRGLELEFCSYVHANAYAGWFQQQGFETHWDDHEVFIAQISGPKHWRVFEPTRKYPITEDYKLKQQPPGSPYWEGDLLPGEVLYIPRGWWHDAIPRGEPTLHLTFGIYRETGFDLVKAIVSSLSECDELRADLPRFATEEAQRTYLSAFREKVTAALTDLTLTDYFRKIDAMAPARVRPSLPWSVMPESVTFPDALWLEWLAPRPMSLETTADEIAFEAIGATFKFRKALAPALTDLATRQRMQFASLCARHCELARHDLQKLVLDLVAARLVAISQDQDSPPI
jgi:ribosomal protein L16 Arg81 hydroxylase